MNRLSILLLGFAGLFVVTDHRVAHSQDIFQSQGPSLTRGHTSSINDLSASRHNPAASSYFMTGNNGWQSNLIGPVSAGYEVGKIDSLIDELDELIDILENEDLSVEQALEAKERFEPFLENAARDGLIKVGGNAALPFFPVFYHNSALGTFTADLLISGSLRSTVLADDIDIIGFNDNFRINTSAALYLKSVGIVSLGLGYSRMSYQNDSGALHTGVKVNINQMNLGKNVLSLAALEDGEDIGDAIQDDYEENANSSVNIGIDVGGLWVSERYTAGFTIKDINEPEYDYGSLISNCSGLLGISLDNCFVAQDAIAQGAIAGSEVYVANAQANIEASAWLGEQFSWGLHSSIDLNDKNDPLGDVYQWASIGATARLNNWFVPELRAGYSKNLAGTELGYYSLGITFFKRAELDIRWADESIDIDGTSAPRSAYISFAIQTKF